MLLESNVPCTYAAGLSEERGRGERYVLRTPEEGWTVVIEPDALHVLRGVDRADVTVSGRAGRCQTLMSRPFRVGRGVLRSRHR